jgi:hypothetical protein
MIEEGKEIESANKSIRSHRVVITGTMIGVSIAFITTVFGAKLPITAPLLVALICFAIGLPFMAVGYVLSPVFFTLFRLFGAVPTIRVALDKTLTLLQSVGQTITAVGIIAIFWDISPVMGIVTTAVIVLPLLFGTLLLLILRPKAKKAVEAGIHLSED